MRNALLYAGFTLLTTAAFVWIKAATGTTTAAALTAEALGFDWRALWPLAAAAALYLVGLGCWLLVMARSALSTAYPIGIGLSLAATSLAGVVWLGEPVDAQRAAGMVLVLAGALIVARDSGRVQRA